ncbi:T9SS type A sorting domain-containing protein [Chryseobacterium binzhouense]|uniref:T9SS type A sorting domain-containing protein n=1 Tax=Chryseobacterium binzhouense TaxID=2593646 RepID=UPI00117D07C6|nr:T9SS type A sorting domain-containing protein [Chryseobacterium binzhouense]
MKKVLSTLGIAILSQFSFAQANCAGALAVTSGSTTTVSSYTGSFVGTCAGSGQATTPFAMWYKFTATANGELTVSSDLPQNNGLLKSDDTRLSIITGACTALSCYGGNDDVSGTNYLSSVTVPVTAGTTYYIVWDNNWSNLGFDFTVNFNTVSCIRPSDFSFTAPTNITTNSASIGWSNAIGTPASYDVQHGASGFALGTGTILNTGTNSASLTNLPVGGNHSYYVRSNCGATQSAWVGPFSIFLAKTAPYSNSFEQPSLSNGFSSSTWSLGNAASGAQDGSIYYFSNSSTTAATNAQLYSRALSFTAGQSVSASFWTRLGATGTAQNLKVYYNTTNSITGATQVGTTINVSGTTYTQQNVTFNIPTTGIYYIIFSNETPIVPTSTSLRLDNVNVTASTLGTNDLVISNGFSISPNPTPDILNIKTDSKINAVSVVDMTGRKVDVKLNGTQVDVRSLPAGTYLINIETKDGISTEKFIKK